VITKPPFTELNFEKAKSAGATVAQIKEHYSIDESTIDAYLKYLEDDGTEN